MIFNDFLFLVPAKRDGRFTNLKQRFLILSIATSGFGASEWRRLYVSATTLLVFGDSWDEWSTVWVGERG